MKTNKNENNKDKYNMKNIVPDFIGGLILLLLISGIIYAIKLCVK